MASSKLLHASAPAQLPESLQAALDEGWRIDEQLSTWEFDAGCRREGFLFLTKPGIEKNAGQLSVPFVALYSARRPYFTFEADELAAARHQELKADPERRRKARRRGK